jgi:predicted 3-demethylubiquinone-9 3-methyltransferase (glyoxalase superfamily)
MENKIKQKITPFLWFDNNAEEAMDFYISIFKNSKIINLRRYPPAVTGQNGTVITGTFQLEGQPFMALNGGPHFTFSPAISLFVNCDTPEEVDHLWEKLSDGGSVQQCGWIKDKFGVSWQIIPSILGELLGDPDPVKSGNVMQAMLKMTKIDSAALMEAYNKA